MGLESATFISQLTATNPIATDKKNQGDDHLRMLKAVLLATLPNADRAFRFPEVVTKSANYTVVEADDAKIIFCDVTAGSIVLTLPAAPSFDGWSIVIVKGVGNANPVFVNNTIFTQVGAVAKLRIDVPWTETRILWNGGAYVKMGSAGEAFPGTFLYWPAAVAPTGHAFPTGQSLSRADYPELFSAWGVTWGAFDGSSFYAPSLLDRFVVEAGNTYALGATGGATGHVISQANLPNYILPNTLGLADPGHEHLRNKGNVTPPAGGGVAVPTVADGGNSWPSGAAFTDMSITGSITLGGSGVAVDHRPPYLGLRRIFRLC